MGTVIKATGLSTDISIHDSIKHAVIAGEECIARASIAKEDIGLLINIGIYRNDNIVEPANAPLIQKALGVNPTYVKGKTTFSFDIMNGPCGFLNAVQVAGAMLKNGIIKYALIVSSDVHPSKRKHVDFPFRNIGAATLLEWSDDTNKGFQEIVFRTSLDSHKGFESILDLHAYGSHGRKNIAINISEDYHENLIAFTAQSIRELYDEHKQHHDINISELILLTSQPVKDFGTKVADKAGLKGKPVECLYEKYGDPHSSSLCIAYHEAIANERLVEGDQVVFLGAGAGLTVAAGLYMV
jgi:3-oxoacyl-[acyl-carrier-protein] synthase-3